jgi:hypothetical protein
MSTEPTDFSVAEGPSADARVWHFALRCDSPTHFTTTVDGQGWSVTWPDLRHRIASCTHRSSLPHDLARWMVDLTQGSMPDHVAKQAVPHIDAWLRANRHRFEDDTSSPPEVA